MPKLVFRNMENKNDRIIKQLIRIIARSTSCLGCGLCGYVCPNSAIVIRKKNNSYKIEIDDKKCTGCLLCNNLCPVGIYYEISFWESGSP